MLGSETGSTARLRLGAQAGACKDAASADLVLSVNAKTIYLITQQFQPELGADRAAEECARLRGRDAAQDRPTDSAG